MSTVQGYCDPAFARVREVFEEGFAEGRELGAAVAVYAEDRKVADLWGGVADRRTGREWLPDTPCFGFSCTKAVTAAAALLLAERGAYEMDGPVTDWWPEFGTAGKEGATAAHLLTHQVGLPAFARPVSAQEAADPAALAGELAAQQPEWTPGEAHGYHALTYGWLAGEIVRRLSGRTVGAYVKDGFARELDLWVGAPDGVIERAAKMSAGRRVHGGGAASPDPSGSPRSMDGDLLTRLSAAYTDPQSAMNRSINNPHPGKGGFNNPVVLHAGWPSAGMLATAPALAAFYRDLSAGRILRLETLRDAIRPRVAGPDRTMLIDSAFGLGFMRPAQTFVIPAAGRESAFGHSGAGGSIGLGDPDAGLALAYLPNLMSDMAAGDLRAYRLTEAAYACLS